MFCQGDNSHRFSRTQFADKTAVLTNLIAITGALTLVFLISELAVSIGESAKRGRSAAEELRRNVHLESANLNSVMWRSIFLSSGLVILAVDEPYIGIFAIYGEIWKFFVITYVILYSVSSTVFVITVLPWILYLNRPDKD
jgi:hypothetical protein